MKLVERHIKGVLICGVLAAFLALIVPHFGTEQDDSFLDWAADLTSILLTLSSSIGIAFTLRRLQSPHDEKAARMEHLQAVRTQASARRNVLQPPAADFKSGVEKQFQLWALTGAEREVGLMILQGLPHKEIAAQRGTTEATARQQAQSIYRKTKLAGKTAFCAYFLEDVWTSEIVKREAEHISTLDAHEHHLSAVKLLEQRRRR